LVIRETISLSAYTGIARSFFHSGSSRKLDQAVARPASGSRFQVLGNPQKQPLKVPIPLPFDFFSRWPTFLLSVILPCPHRTESFSDGQNSSKRGKCRSYRPANWAFPANPWLLAPGLGNRLPQTLFRPPALPLPPSAPREDGLLASFC